MEFLSAFLIWLELQLCVCPNGHYTNSPRNEPEAFDSQKLLGLERQSFWFPEALEEPLLGWKELRSAGEV